MVDILNVSVWNFTFQEIMNQNKIGSSGLKLEVNQR